MAADHSTEVAPSDRPTAAAIDNEFPAYRALSASAIVATLLGIASILAFANPIFLVAAGAAILVGLLADRKIHRRAQFLTGQNFARAGVVLGTIFGLGSISASTVQMIVQNIQAKRYASVVEGILQKKSLGEAVLQQYSPEERAKLSVAQALEAFNKSGPGGPENSLSPLSTLMKRLNSSPQQQIHLARIESVGPDGLDVAAGAMFDLDGPPSPEFPKGEEFALIVLKAQVSGGRYAWRMDDIIYPYTPDSYTPKPTKVDDGHGHNH